MVSQSSRRHGPPSPARLLFHSETTGLPAQLGQSRHCYVLSDIVATVSLSAWVVTPASPHFTYTVAWCYLLIVYEYEYGINVSSLEGHCNGFQQQQMAHRVTDV